MVRAPADLLLLLLNALGKGWLFTRPPRDLLLSCFLNLGLEILELSLSATEVLVLFRLPADLLLLIRNVVPSSRSMRDLLLSCFLDLGLDILELSSSATEVQDTVRASADLLLLLLNASTDGWILVTHSPRAGDLLFSCFLDLVVDILELSSSATEVQDTVLLLNVLVTHSPKAGDLLFSCSLDLGLEILELSSSATAAQDLVRAPAGLLILFRTVLVEDWPSSRTTRDLLLSCFLDPGMILEFSSSVAKELILLRKVLAEDWPSSRSTRDLLLSCFLDPCLAFLEFSSSVAKELILLRKVLAKNWLFAPSRRDLLFPCSLGLDEICNRRLGIALKTSKLRALLIFFWWGPFLEQITLVVDAGKQEEV